MQLPFPNTSRSLQSLFHDFHTLHESASPELRQTTNSSGRSANTLSLSTRAYKPRQSIIRPVVQTNHHSPKQKTDIMRFGMIFTGFVTALLATATTAVLAIKRDCGDNCPAFTTYHDRDCKNVMYDLKRTVLPNVCIDNPFVSLPLFSHALLLVRRIS